MTTLETRRTAWDVTEGVRLTLFRNGDQPNPEALHAHAREGRILAAAVAILTKGAPGVFSPPLDANELAEAAELAGQS